MEDNGLIFLSYASPDRERVVEFSDYLAHHGLNVWIDKRRLKGGQNWDFEIKRALQKAAVIVIFLSSNSVDRRGYAQREIKIALDQARDKLIDDIYLIPVMLEESVPIPVELERIHIIQANEADHKIALVDAINSQLERLGVETARLQGETKLRWTLSTYKDTWEGLPGYDTSFELLRFSSDEYPQASEMTDVMRGWLMSSAMKQREIKFEQCSGEHYHFGKERFFRQNSWDALCGEPRVKGRVVTIVYNVYWYGAGAAHPNQFYRTFAFALDPLIMIDSLREIFRDHDQAFALIQGESRTALLSERSGDESGEDQPYTLDKNYVEEGTKDWSDFDNFVFGESGIDILFSPYQVAAYVFGPQVVTIDYKKLTPLMHKTHACVLGVEHANVEPYAWPIEL